MSFEELLAANYSGRPTGFAITVRKVVTALRAIGVEFAVAGGLALGKRGYVRSTIDLDLLIEPGAWQAVLATLRGAGFRLRGPADPWMMTFVDSETGIRVDILFGHEDPEESARVTASPMMLFGTRVPVVGANYLLWMYLLSDQSRHMSDAVALIRRHKVDVAWLMRTLSREDPESLEIFKSYVIRARAEEQSDKRRRKRRPSRR